MPALNTEKGMVPSEIQSFREAAIRWPRGDPAPDFRERGLSAFQRSDVTASYPRPLGLGQAWRLPRKAQQKATVSHALDLSARSWERMRRKRCQQGAGLLAGQEAPASLGSSRGRVNRGPLARCCFVQPGLLLGLAEPGRLELTPQLRAGRDRDPSLAWVTRGLT